MEFQQFQPAWMTDELNQVLGRITGHSARKKRSTVLRLAEGEAIGRTQRDTFKLPDTCSWKTWDGKYREGVKRPGWRTDPIIQEALAAATKRAHWYQDQAEVRRIAKRQEEIARARDKLAELAYPAALKLGALLGADSVETARRAANDILDRADRDLASKAEVYERGEREQRIQFDLSELPVELLRVLANGPDEKGAEGNSKEPTSQDGH